MIIGTVLAIILLIMLYRLSVQARLNHHKRLLAKVDAFWQEVESKYPGTLERINKLRSE